ncbi:hypothetical protein G7062_05320 [Erysipelothrix sp. HDW6C]|uniref:hypothetical protein n=1 Tax=Erysipelothrix sp. HDW6C TaxID=2714930 RepID=UPI00140C36B8|nr:hypothetical protein [Erysipelothrix sp. HDW6C]QIK69752.1 hypothetical protein G7062_05320 [Erysipelothrix sp. HDW6C]
MPDLKDLFNLVNPDKDGDGKGDNELLNSISDAVSGDGGDLLGGLLGSLTGGAKQADTPTGSDGNTADLLTNAIKGITEGGANNAAQTQLEQNGINAGSLSSLLGGLLGGGGGGNTQAAQPQQKGMLDTLLGGALSQLTGGSAAPAKNQGNQFLDMIMKILASKVASDALTGVVKSFAGGMLGGVQNGIAAGGTPEIDVMGTLKSALVENDVDSATVTEVLDAVKTESQTIVE